MAFPALSRCVSLDLEISPDDSTLMAAAAYRPDTGASLSLSNRPSHGSLQQLDRIADGAQFLLGHNIIKHDLPHLQNYNHDLQLLNLPVVDTLRLNPLAYPQRPYHHLVKHYKDAGLVRRQSNDPLLDCKLAIEAFSNQLERLKESPPDLLAAWHWLTTVQNRRGFRQGLLRHKGQPQTHGGRGHGFRSPKTGRPRLCGQHRVDCR